MLVQRTPGGVLAEFVQTIWYSSREAAPHSREAALPSGGLTLTVNLGPAPIRIYRNELDSTGLSFPEAVIWGPQTRYAVRDTSLGRSVVGVQFRPGLASVLFGLCGADLTDRFISLQDAWGGRGSRMREVLLEAGSPDAKLTAAVRFLERRVVTGHRPHAVALYGLREFARPDAPQVSEVQVRSGYSARRFIELFVEAAGMTPNRYRRLMRFQHVLKRAAKTEGKTNWSRIAAESGFTDQAHLTHEFKSFSGITPGAYAPVSPGWSHHVAVRQVKNLQDPPHA